MNNNAVVSVVIIFVLLPLPPPPPLLLLLLLLQAGSAVQAKLDESEQKLQQTIAKLVSVREQAENESSQSKEKVADLQRQLEQQAEEMKQLGTRLEDALEKHASLAESQRSHVTEVYAELDGQWCMPNSTLFDYTCGLNQVVQDTVGAIINRIFPLLVVSLPVKAQTFAANRTACSMQIAGLVAGVYALSAGGLIDIATVKGYVQDALTGLEKAKGEHGTAAAAVATGAIMTLCVATLMPFTLFVEYFAGFLLALELGVIVVALAKTLAAGITFLLVIDSISAVIS